jgi:hypothetical protein
MVEQDDKDEQDRAPDGRHIKEIDRAPRDDVFVSGQLQRSGCALVVHDERPPPRRFSSAGIITMQTATHARGRA